MESLSQAKDAKFATIRMRSDVANRVIAMMKIINLKEFGKKIKPSDLIAYTLDLVTERDIEALKQKSLRNIDLLEMQFKQFSKKK